MPRLLCEACCRHYGDLGPCDEGKPLASPHRKGVRLPKVPCSMEVAKKAAEEGAKDV